MAAIALALKKLDVPEVDGVTYDEVIDAGEYLPGMAALWDVGTPEERVEMVMLILEPEGLYYDTELKIIAALKPRPAFLPILRMLNGVVEYKEASGLSQASHWSQRNRRDMNHRSHLAFWDDTTVLERQEMIVLMLEPGGLYFDLENKIIAAIKPRPAFLPILRMLNGVVEYEEANGLIVTERWQDRNRRALNHRSHLALIPIEKLFAHSDDILVYTTKPGSDYAQSDDPFEQALDNPVVIPSYQNRPRPDEPKWKIPTSEWPNVVRRVIENQEPLRKVAEDYGVSYETVRRTIRASCKRSDKEQGREC